MTRMMLPIFFLLMACGPGGPGEEAGAGQNEAEHSEDQYAESIHVEPEHVEEWGLEVALPGRTLVSSEVELPGVITTNDNRTARIASLVAGQLAGLRADLGDRVSAGQTLAVLNAPEFTRAQTEFLRAYAQAELSREDYERALVLRDERAIEEREFLRRQSLVEQHLAELRSAEVILHSLGLEEEQLRAMTAGLNVEARAEAQSAVDALLPIRTPTSGVIIQRDAVRGDHIEPGRTLFTVSDLSTLWARLDAYEEQIPLLDASAEVIIRTSLLPDRAFPGTISFIAEQMDPELRTVRVRVDVPNPTGELKPNMYVQGFLRTVSEGPERLILPEEAIQLHEGHHTVFVRLPAEAGEAHVVFESRHVEVGETFTDGVVILEGLDGSEEVVTKGAFTLKAEITKGAGGHAHVH